MNHDTISRLSEIAAVWSYEKYSKTETGYTREHWQSCKLAELIVEECVKDIETAAYHDSCEDWEYGYNSGLNKAKELIVSHFEVEE